MIIFRFGKRQDRIESVKKSFRFRTAIRRTVSRSCTGCYRAIVDYVTVIAASSIVFRNLAFAHVEPKFFELNGVGIEKVLHFSSEVVPLSDFFVSYAGLDRCEYSTERSSGSVERLSVCRAEGATPSDNTTDDDADKGKDSFGHGISNVIALIIGIFIGHWLVIRLT
jgi:hypothetical protein